MSETTLGALARTLADELGVKILSPEFEILLSLYDHGRFSARELQLRSSASSTGFYARLKMLTRTGIIRLAKGSDDRRLSLYTLAPETRRILDEAFGALDDWAGARTAPREGGCKSFDWLLAWVSNRLDLTLLSPEFSVIMNIYDCEPIGTSELFYRTRLANSKFYAVLTVLAAQRRIIALIDRRDRRRRLYCLPRRVRKQLDQVLRDFRVNWPQPEPA